MFRRLLSGGRLPRVPHQRPPLPDENIAQPCCSDITTPADVAEVRAVFVILDRGQDWVKFYHDPQVRSFAASHALALQIQRARRHDRGAASWCRAVAVPGAPWTFALQNRTPHCCLQNAQPLILAWLDGVLAGAKASRGFLKLEESTLRDGWKLPVSTATAARIGTTARKWLAFERRHDP